MVLLGRPAGFSRSQHFLTMKIFLIWTLAQKERSDDDGEFDRIYSAKK
jgi:hypothetical protein